MGQCKSKDQDLKSYANAVFRPRLLLFAGLSTKTLRKLKRQCKSGGKDFKRDYSKEQLRENMWQTSLRREVLKNSKGVRP
jgi:hypothetical protein